MILRLPSAQIDGILGAMRAIALAHGPEGLTDMDRATITAAARIVFGQTAVDRTRSNSARPRPWPAPSRRMRTGLKPYACWR